MVSLLFCCGEFNTERYVVTSPVHSFELSEETKEYLVSIYTQVVDNPNSDELLFTNYGSEVGVVITDYNGNFIEKVGEKGRGPKELQSSRYFGAQNDSKVVVLDKALAFFKVFDRSSEEVQLFPYPIKDGISVTSREITFCNDRWFTGVQLNNSQPFITTPTIGVFDTSFVLVDTLGGYDPFFQGRRDILQETTYDLNCEENKIYTVQGKTPNIQVFSIDSGNRLGITSKKPPSFNLSDKFIELVTSPQEMTRYLSEEQSISLHVTHNDKYLFLVFRNDGGIYRRRRVLNESIHFVAVFDRESLEYVGEVQLDGAILGSTKDGYLIVLKDEDQLRFEIIEVSVINK